MQVTLLGPVACRYEGVELPLGGLKQRAVFALLALEAGRVVSLDRLVHELWPDDPPARSVVALRAYVSRLRRVLEATPAHIRTRRPGWVLEIPPGSTDLARFTELHVRARAALGSRGPEAVRRAIRDADEALGLWSGSALADLEELPFARDEATRLAELYDAAVETWLDARLANGEHEVVVERAQLFLAERPFRERAWSALLLALYRGGRQVEALAAYATLRRTLADDLGLDPSPRLQDLEQQMLRHDPGLRTTLPPELPSVPGPAEAGEGPALGGRADVLPVLAVGGWPVVGRGGTSARLRASVTAATRGRGGLVVVGAPAGAGKTTMLRMLEEEVVAAGGLVLHGNGLAEGAAPALWPWVTALGELVDALPGLVDGRWGPDEPARIALAALGPAPPGAEPQLAPPLNRTLLFRGVIDLLREARSRTPLAVLLDDAHWVDAETRTLLALACEELAERGVLFVVAARTDEPVDDLTRSLGSVRRDLVERVALDPLGSDDVATLISAIDGREAAAGVAEAVLEQTGGNALFVVELVQLLSAEGRLTRSAVGGTVPRGARDVLGRRLDRLPVAARSLLGVAGLVAPRPFDLDLLARISGLDEEQALDACEAAMLAGLVVEQGHATGRLALSHGLLRETLVSRLSGPRQVHLHAKIAAVLEQRGPTRTDDVLEVARHLVLAAPAVGPAAAVPYLVSAAADSLARSAAGAARSILTTALELVAQISDVRQRESSHGLVQGQLDTVRVWTATFGEDAASTPPRGVAAPAEGPAGIAWVGTVIGWAVRGHYAWAVAEASDVLAGRPGEVVEHLARYVRATMASTAGDRQTAHHDLDLLKATIRAGGDAGLPGLPLDFVADVHAYRGLLAHQDGDEAGTDAELADLAAWAPRSKTSQVKAEFYLALVAAMRRDTVAARAHAHRSQRLARELDFAVFQHQLDVVHAWAEALGGDAEAPARADLALATHRDQGVRYFEPSYLLLVAEAYAHQGNLATARRRARESSVRADELGEHYLSPRLASLGAALHVGDLLPGGDLHPGPG